MLETVLQYGTAKSAAIGQFAAGKTGTTSNFGDAWFVGWDKKYTVAVWVGYPNKLIPMTTDFGGQPVFGGTYPALIWHDFMLAAMQVEQARANHTALAKGAKEGTKEAASGGQETTSPAETGTGGGSSSSKATGGAGGSAGHPRQHGGSGRWRAEAPNRLRPPRHRRPPRRSRLRPPRLLERKLEIGRRRSHRWCQPNRLTRAKPWILARHCRQIGAEALGPRLDTVALPQARTVEQPRGRAPQPVAEADARLPSEQLASVARVGYPHVRVPRALAHRSPLRQRSHAKLPARYFDQLAQIGLCPRADVQHRSGTAGRAKLGRAQQRVAAVLRVYEVTGDARLSKSGQPASGLPRARDTRGSDARDPPRDRRSNTDAASPLEPPLPPPVP